MNEQLLCANIIDEQGAYALGWIAAKGTIIVDGGIAIAVSSDRGAMLRRLQQLFGGGEIGPLQPDDQVQLTIPSVALARAAGRLLEVEAGDHGFPRLASQALGWAFVRGCFDAAGSVAEPSSECSAPRCHVAVSSSRLRAGIRRHCAIRSGPDERRGCLEYTGANALDLLSQLYEGVSLCLARHQQRYRDWCCWVPWLSGSQRSRPLLRWARTDERAVAPFKERASDSGYDLTLIRQAERRGLLRLYGTGLRISPEPGWYFDVVARSSIIKSGHVLANSVGVIDRAYRGEILVPLLKLEPEAPELVLPCRIVQLVPRPIVHFEVCLVDELDDTSRGAGGFGSTG